MKCVSRILVPFCQVERQCCERESHRAVSPWIVERNLYSQKRVFFSLPCSFLSLPIYFHPRTVNPCYKKLYTHKVYKINMRVPLTQLSRRNVTEQFVYPCRLSFCTYTERRDFSWCFFFFFTKLELYQTHSLWNYFKT